MKLVLFDIDGTLVMTGGAGKRAMNRAFEQLCGVAAALQGITMAGRTDRVIVRDALLRIPRPAESEEQWLARFREVYCGFLEEEMASGAGSGKRVLPGVWPLLETLTPRPDVVVGLLTGNFHVGARIKLGHFGLWDYLPWGAFGDEHADRNALFAVALQAAREHGRMTAPPDRVFIVGDTPHDVACAKSGGATAIAVATGFHSADDLRNAGADVVFEDLSDTAAVLRVIDDPPGA